MASDGFMGTMMHPYRDICQSLDAFLLPGGICHDPHMDEQDYTRANIRHLLDLRGLKISNLAIESGAGQSWVSRYMSGKFERNIAKIELIAKYLGVPAHRLMYEDLAGTSPSAASQSVGTEQEIVAAAVKLERELAAMSPTPLPPETYAQRLFVAMKVVQAEGAASVLDGSGLVEAIRHLAAELRRAG